MKKYLVKKRLWIQLGILLVAAISLVLTTSFLFALPSGLESSAHPAALPQDDGPQVAILNDAELPDGYPRVAYEYRFHAHGGTSLHWRVGRRIQTNLPSSTADGNGLPPGLKLEDDGLLHGQPERGGEYQFIIVVDGGTQVVQKNFVLRIRSALSINWKSIAHVNGNRIEGSVEATNASPDDMDLTFVVMAIAPNGRATAIGYQHFDLKRGTITMELPFGETLPPGAYNVHVDAVGEIAEKNQIYREKMDTPRPLHVTVGP
jgi:hypothetical protein